MASSRLSKKELYRPPSYGELKNLEFADKQLNSHLFSLQIDELLKEVIVTEEGKNGIERFVSVLSKFLKSLSPCGQSVALQDIVSPTEADIDVKIPFPRDLLESVSLKGVYNFSPPEKVKVIGSWKIFASINKCIDVAVVMPKGSLQEKDYLNYRCLLKRALFIRDIASRIRSEVSICHSDLFYSYIDGNVLWPCLNLKPTENSAKKFTIRLIPFFERATMKFSRFISTVSNIRLDDCLAISLAYNQTILADLVMDDLQNQIETVFGIRGQLEDDTGPHFGLIYGLKMLKIWTKQRESLISIDSGISGHFWTLVLIHFFNSKRINQMMTPLQVFRVSLQLLSSPDFGVSGTMNILGSQEAALCDAKSLDWSSFDVILNDASGYHNFTYKMSTSTLQKLKLLAMETVSSIDAFDQFGSVFLIKISPTDFYDQIWSFRLDDLSSIVDSVSPKTIDALVEVKRLILDKLNEAIGARVKCIDFIDERIPVVTAPFGVTKLPPSGLVDFNEGLELKIGVTFNPETFLDIIDKGPRADTPEARKFRMFWKAKSELRRFQDGAILEAVIWDEVNLLGEANVPASERTILSRRLITYQAACWILENNFGIKRSTLFCSDIGFSRILTPHLRKCPISVYGSGEEVYLNLISAYDRLTKMLKPVERKLALGFQSVQGVGQAFRFTATFPPLPSSFEQFMTDIVENSDSRQPSAKKLCPPYIAPNDVIITLEGSSNWPDDWNAFRRIRAALHVQFFRFLSQEWPEVAKQASTSWVDVVVDSFVFRLKLRCQHELNILRMQKDESSGKISMSKVHENPEAVKLNFEIHLQPKLTSVLHSIASGQNFSYAATSRLVKRWFSSHLFSEHLSEDVIDIMVANLFVSGNSLPRPVSPVAGFLRFLKHFATHDWRLNPLVVNLNSEFSHDEINDTLLEFAKSRSNFPPLSIISPVDPFSSWTDQKPCVVVLNRMLTMAAKTYEKLCSIVLKKASNSQNVEKLVKNVFTPDFSAFDVVIELDSKFISRRHEAVNISEKIYTPKFKEEMHFNNGPAGGSSNKFPVVGLDMQEKFVDELKMAYGDVALFFYNRYGGTKIGIVWKPSIEREFKVQNMNLSQPIIADESKTGKEVQLSPNRAAALTDIKFIGQGLISNVVTKNCANVVAGLKSEK